MNLTLQISADETVKPKEEMQYKLNSFYNLDELTIICHLNYAFNIFIQIFVQLYIQQDIGKKLLIYKMS